MRLNLRKFFAAAVSLCISFSCFVCTNIFAGETDIVHYDTNAKVSTVNSVPDGATVV